MRGVARYPRVYSDERARTCCATEVHGICRKTTIKRAHGKNRVRTIFTPEYALANINQIIQATPGERLCREASSPPPLNQAIRKEAAQTSRRTAGPTPSQYPN